MSSTKVRKPLSKVTHSFIFIPSDELHILRYDGYCDLLITDQQQDLFLLLYPRSEHLPFIWPKVFSLHGALGLIVLVCYQFLSTHPMTSKFGRVRFHAYTNYSPSVQSASTPVATTALRCSLLNTRSVQVAVPQIRTPTFQMA